MNITHQTANERPSADTGRSVLASLRALIPQRETTFIEALRIAEQQAQRFLSRLEVTDGPIDVDVLYALPRLTVECVPGMPSSGCSFWDADRGRWIIHVNADEPRTRQRFTIFHEYKHIIDHGRTDLLYGNGPEADRRAEQAAEFFAGCLLMPRPLVKRAWCNGIQTPWGLAQRFDVSVVAAGVRLAQIGLADPTSRCEPPKRPTDRPSQTPRRWPRTYRRAFSAHRPHALTTSTLGTTGVLT